MFPCWIRFTHIAHFYHHPSPVAPKYQLNSLSVEVNGKMRSKTDYLGLVVTKGLLAPLARKEILSL